MELDLTIRLTEVLLGFALTQQSTEHIVREPYRFVFISQAILGLCLMAGYSTVLVCPALCVIALMKLHLFQGPYNGGSDRMGMLILFVLTLAHLCPDTAQPYAFGYLAIQLILSYVMAGFVKLRNPEWRNGQALCDVFSFSIYPISENLRKFQNNPALLVTASWAVILFEILFPLSLLNSTTLFWGLILAGLFHFMNALLFGLNRFIWVWLAAYPSLIWFQTILV